MDSDNMKIEYCIAGEKVSHVEFLAHLEDRFASLQDVVEVWRGCYDSGQPKYEIHRNSKRKRHGWTRWWHPSGQLISETQYNNGELHGVDRGQDGEEYWVHGQRVTREEYEATQ